MTLKPCTCPPELSAPQPSGVGHVVCGECGGEVTAQKIEGAAASKRATLPPEKAEALREIHNLRREFNARLDRLKAEVLKP